MVFVVERCRLMDRLGDVIRLPGNAMLSMPVGQDIAKEVVAPVVVGIMELMGLSWFLWGGWSCSGGGSWFPQGEWA